MSDFDDDSTLGIDFEVDELSDALDAFDKIIERIERANEASEKLYSSWNRLATINPSGVPGIQGGQLVPRGGGSGSQTPPQPQGTPRGSSFAQGPYQRLEKLHQQLGLAQAQGNTNAEKDILLGIDRANKQIARSQPKSFGQVLGTAIRSTRFGAGGLEPLIGRSLDVIGAGAEAAGIDLAPETMGISLIVATVFAALIEVVGKATEKIMEMADAAAQADLALAHIGITTGSTGPESLRLQNAALSVGMSPQNMGALSTAFNQAITTDAMARAAGARLGITNMPRPFGSLDEGRNLLTFLGRLRQLDRPSQIRELRMLGPVGDQLSPFLFTSNRQNEFMLSDAAMQHQMGIDSLQFQTQSADLEAAMGRVTASFTTLEEAGLKPFLPALTDLMNAVATTVNLFAKEAPRLEQAFSLMLGGALGFLLTTLAQHAKGNDDNKSATDKNTDALDRNTTALGAVGTYGRSDRLPDALGTGMDGQALQQLLATKQIHQINAF